MNEMEKFKTFYQGNGSLTDEGEEFLAPFKKTLSEVFSDEIVSELNTAQIRILGSTLANLVGNAVCDAIQRKDKLTSPFDSMSDAQFEEYLVSKYGDDYFFKSLTPDEFKRVQPISKKKMQEVFEEMPTKPLPIHYYKK
jgi:hypothetical protein